jgi:hypothetical protein
MFPALDADLTLSPAEETTTVLTLAGVYRLPGQAPAGLDPVDARRFAALTIRSLSPGSPVLWCIPLARQFG